MLALSTKKMYVKKENKKTQNNECFVKSLASLYK